jgi:hypothetical protein
VQVVAVSLCGAVVFLIFLQGLFYSQTRTVPILNRGELGNDLGIPLLLPNCFLSFLSVFFPFYLFSFSFIGFLSFYYYLFFTFYSFLFFLLVL